MGGIRAKLRHRFHEQRADLFVRLIKPRTGATLLDLGGGDGSLAARICERVPLDVCIADVRADNREACERRGFRHVLVEPGPLPFEDGAFDYLLCNSVIEHVTLPLDECRIDVRVPQSEWHRRSREAQAAFAREVARVSTSYFVQTPHASFPIDQHVHLPFSHYFNHNIQCGIVGLTDRYWVKSCGGVVDWELLSPSDMARIFPDASITIERFAGLPKSIVAWTADANIRPT
jgi:hypothetical protein